MLENDGQGSVALVDHATSWGHGAGVALTDLDADGRTDLLVAEYEVVTALRDRSAPPAATSAYGAGTPGCAGTIGIAATAVAAPGATDFRVRATGAPSGGVGLLLAGLGMDATGSDPFGLGVTLHVDLLTAPWLAIPVTADLGGFASAALPIPANPGLTNDVLLFQHVFLPATPAACAGSPLGLTSSRGLRVVIQ